VSEPIHDDTDRRLIAALHAVDVPTDLQSRLERSLHVAMLEQELLESQYLKQNQLKENPETIRRTGSLLWNRRNAIAAVVAAGLGGVVLGYRQLTQPLSQARLVACTQRLLDQIKGADWQTLSPAQAVAVNGSLQAVGFLRQVRGVTLTAVCSLQPPSNIQSAMAYDFGNDIVLLDLTIERRVQQISHTLRELAWPRSGTIAFAMSSEQRTLVIAGPASMRRNILPPQTT
jgi:hypothetical protein